MWQLNHTSIGRNLAIIGNDRCGLAIISIHVRKPPRMKSSLFDQQEKASAMTDIHGGRVLAGEDSEEDDDDDDEGALVFCLCCSVRAVSLCEEAGWVRRKLTKTMNAIALDQPTASSSAVASGRRAARAPVRRGSLCLALLSLHKRVEKRATRRRRRRKRKRSMRRRLVGVIKRFHRQKNPPAWMKRARRTRRPL